MRLLFDENLSPRLVAAVADLFAGSQHARDLGLERADDSMIWQEARRLGFAIVTKDDDFRQRSFVFGPPPKVLWLRVGNCSTDLVADLLRERLADIENFALDPETALLVLDRRRRSDPRRDRTEAEHPWCSSSRASPTTPSGRLAGPDRRGGAFGMSIELWGGWQPARVESWRVPVRDGRISHSPQTRGSGGDGVVDVRGGDTRRVIDGVVAPLADRRPRVRRVAVGVVGLAGPCRSA